MKAENFTVYAVDGDYPGLFGEKIPLPPQITRHRPDAIGIKPNGQLCIGEAKTESDLSNQRTYEQLQDFTSLEINGHVCEVVLGLPQSGKDIFRKNLQRLGLISLPNIHVMYIPDEIINEK